jgi:general stress protein YciG
MVRRTNSSSSLLRVASVWGVIIMLSKESSRGFASMDRDHQREIASKGGKAAHTSGKAHQFTSEQAREAGRKGGMAVSRDRNHMALIGRKGGHAVSSDRAHMARIGTRGGVAVSQKRHRSDEVETVVANDDLAQQADKAS